jgi:hypothetical protein
MGVSTISKTEMIENNSLLLSCIIEGVKNIWKFITTSVEFWASISLILVTFLIWLLVKYRKKYRVTSVNITLPFSLGNITCEPTEEDRIVAWKLYTQLKTRKAALVFDEDYDVIADVYDSLYEIFPISRDLLMNLPLYEIERESSIANLVLRVQNDGLRPHLTKWQSTFRKWWDNAIKDTNNKDISPQEIQKKYPKYTELITELKKMNTELIKYAEDLLNIAKPQVKKANIKKLIPIQPSEKNSISANSEQKLDSEFGEPHT